jgi:hypothetical protein
MRRVHMSIRVTAWLVSCGAVAGATFAIGLQVGAARVEKSPPSQNDTFASRFPGATTVDANKPAVRGATATGAHNATAPRLTGLDLAAEAEPPRGFEAPHSAALRYGVVELLPAGLTHSMAGSSALLRAIIEAATAAAVEPVPEADRPIAYPDRGALPTTEGNAANELRTLAERDTARRVDRWLQRSGEQTPEMIQLRRIDGKMPFP